jgi:hypothetical protein
MGMRLMDVERRQKMLICFQAPGGADAGSASRDEHPAIGGRHGHRPGQEMIRRDRGRNTP